MIATALRRLRPTSSWACDGETYEGIQWFDELNPQPTKAEVEAEIVKIKAEYAAKEYQRQRAAEYPSIQEQLDMQYWDSVNGTTTWQDAINAIKTKYPKPEEQ